MPMGEYSDGADIQMLPWYCWYVAKGGVSSLMSP